MATGDNFADKMTTQMEHIPVLLNESEKNYQLQRRYMFYRLLQTAKSEKYGKDKFLELADKLDMLDLVKEYSHGT